MTNWNTYFNRIRMSHKMERHDVVAACRAGGLEITASRAEGWARGSSDTRRHVRMAAEEFDAFTRGLVEWAREVYRDPD